MDEIHRLLEDIVTLAELQDEFYEVEAMVCVKRRHGAESDFIRMELAVTDGIQYKVARKGSRPSSAALPLIESN